MKLNSGRLMTSMLCLLPAIALAEVGPPGGGFSVPVNCTLGEDCWVMNYPDMADGPEVQDPYCGRRSYDGHQGTDIAIRDLATMRRGVAVIAAASGRVLRRRDTMDDKLMRSEADRRALGGRDCGNGVLIDHGDGWRTQYCHLRKGSVVVNPGDYVRRHQKLGLVGLSGRTAFPHLHMSVRRDGINIDPTTGQTVPSTCGKDSSSLWKNQVLAGYRAGTLYAVGVSTGPVTKPALLESAVGRKTMSRKAPAFVVWATAFGVAPGGEIHFSIRAPDGREIYKGAQSMKRHQAWRFAYGGIRRRSDVWPLGVYRATARYRRPVPTNRADVIRQIEFVVR